MEFAKPNEVSRILRAWLHCSLIFMLLPLTGKRVPADWLKTLQQCISCWLPGHVPWGLSSTKSREQRSVLVVNKWGRTRTKKYQELIYWSCLLYERMIIFFTYLFSVVLWTWKKYNCSVAMLINYQVALQATAVSRCLQNTGTFLLSLWMPDWVSHDGKI